MMIRIRVAQSNLASKFHTQWGSDKLPSNFEERYSHVYKIISPASLCSIMEEPCSRNSPAMIHSLILGFSLFALYEISPSW
ncbi:hypothetical protein A0H81_02925 [Grifola frondosa]|uniref:Uncharacterized protein n=1 Tax=Grifola frondosa TaxID=5627 RepID=A0A1C7MJ93_GRIFR|nr:hypothetical protein A0H81_02925 [Grifola frondosa]